MSDINEIEAKNRNYLASLFNTHTELLTLSASIRFSLANLLKHGNEVDADSLRGFVDAIETVDGVAKHFQWLIEQQQRLMTAKPGEIIALD